MHLLSSRSQHDCGQPNDPDEHSDWIVRNEKKLINRLEEICFTRSLPLALAGTSLTLDDLKYFYSVR